MAWAARKSALLFHGMNHLTSGAETLHRTYPRLWGVFAMRKRIF